MKKILWFINHAINLIYPNVCGICEEICNDSLCKKCEIKLRNIVKNIIEYVNNKGEQLIIFD